MTFPTSGGGLNIGPCVVSVDYNMLDFNTKHQTQIVTGKEDTNVKGKKGSFV